MRLTRDDERARRICSLALDFMNSSSPLRSSEIARAHYPGLSADSFRRAFSRDRSVLASCGVVVVERRVPGEESLWEADRARSFARGAELSATEAATLELACRPLPQKASRRRWIQVAGLVAVFLVSYIAYLLLLSAQLQELDTSNTLPLYGRCLLPAITSAACFFTSYEAHPAGQRAALLEHQMLELQHEINQVSAEVQRGHAVLSLFDANAFDELQMQNALRQAELGELEERNKLRGMLLEALPTQDGVKAFLLDKLLAADVTDQANEIRQGAHPMPTPQPADAHDTPDQHESVAFPA